MRTLTVLSERFLNVCVAPAGTEADCPGESVIHSPSTITSRLPSITS